MTGPLTFLDPNNPQARALMERNPNGVMATMLKAAWQRTGSASSDPAIGSNNAGGVMSNPTATTNNRPSFGQYTGNGSGLMGPMITAMGPYARGQYQGGYTISGGDQGANNNNGFYNGGPVSFAAGGMVAPGGGAIRPGAGMQQEPQLGATSPAPVGGQQVEQEAQRFVQQHPEQVQQIQSLMQMAMQSGELTPEELNMMVQLAKTAIANPASYAQVRQYAIQNGVGTEAEIPQQMDEGLLYVVIVAGMALQGGPNEGAEGESPTQQSSEGPLMEKYEGMTGDKPHIAKVHPREYIVPEDALIYHGKKHFDKLVEQARTPPDAK